ncbi:MAG: hypothetical protein JSS81_27905 [Acidobacteria bacterium]|nr:hypothetical protein [Acidobacteriota bacterium]
MLKPVICIFILGVLVFRAAGQTTPAPAPDNPLDCAFYLLGKDEGRFITEKLSLADYYRRVDRPEKALEVLERLDDGGWKSALQIEIAGDYEKKGKHERAVAIYKDVVAAEGFESAYKDRELAAALGALVALGHAADALGSITDENSPIDRAFGLLAIAEALNEKGDQTRAFEMLPGIVELAGKTEWKDLELLAKAKAGSLYLRAGRTKEAEALYAEVIKNAPAVKEVGNIFVDDLWKEIAGGYRAVKNFDRAIEVLSAYRQTNTLNSANLADRNLIEIYLETNRKEKVFELVDAGLAEDESYTAESAAEYALKLGDVETARSIYRRIEGVRDYADYTKIKLALALSDFYAKNGQTVEAVDILNQILKQVERIETDSPESGLMSTSPAMEKAGYLGQLAEKFTGLRNYAEAERIVRSIGKPYYRAAGLTALAVGRNDKISVKLLDQALEILRRTPDSLLDATKYRVWCKIAAAYAKTGQREKALAAFAELLGRDREIYDAGMETYLVQVLAESGYYFEISGLKPDNRIKSALQKIIKNWEEEKY